MAVQKGFGLPAELGVVIVSPGAFEKALFVEKTTRNIGSYHNFKILFKYAQKGQTPETPNVFNMYLFENVLHDMQKIGISKIRKETDQKTDIIYNFLEQHDRYSPFVKSQEFQSNTTIIAKVRGGSKVLIEKLKSKGCIVGAGYGMYKDEHIRIANFPAHTIQNVAYLIKVLGT